MQEVMPSELWEHPHLPQGPDVAGLEQPMSPGQGLRAVHPQSETPGQLTSSTAVAWHLQSLSAEGAVHPG